MCVFLTFHLLLLTNVMQRMEKLSQMRPIFLFFIASDQFFSSDIGLGWGWDKKIIVNEFKGFVDVDVGFF